MHHVKDFHTGEKIYLVSDGFGFFKKIALFLLILFLTLFFSSAFCNFFLSKLFTDGKTREKNISNAQVYILFT